MVNNSITIYRVEFTDAGISILLNKIGKYLHCSAQIKKLKSVNTKDDLAFTHCIGSLYDTEVLHQVLNKFNCESLSQIIPFYQMARFVP